MDGMWTFLVGLIFGFVEVVIIASRSWPGSSSVKRMVLWLGSLRGVCWRLRVWWRSMDWKRSALECQRVKICGQDLLGFLLICTIHTSSAVTDPTDGKDSYSFGILRFGILRGLPSEW